MGGTDKPKWVALLEPEYPLSLNNIFNAEYETNAWWYTDIITMMWNTK